MRFEHQGMALWYSTPDAPAPEGPVPEGAELLVTVGLLPADASNRVELRYWVNQGAVERVAATWVRNEVSSGAQYFAARLPALRAGDVVEYTPIGTCGGRQVPSPDDAARPSSSLRVLAADPSLPPSASSTENSFRDAASDRPEPAETSIPRGDVGAGIAAGAVDPLLSLTGARKPADLAGLEPSDWQVVIETAGLCPPTGLTPEAFARDLTEHIASVLPTDFVMHRATAIPPGLVDLVATVLAQPSADPPQPFVRLSRRNPGLGIEGVVAGAGGAADTAREIERRVGLVAEVWSSNPGRDLLILDYSVDSSEIENLSGMPEDPADRQMVVDNLKAQQRVFLVAEDAAAAVSLLDAGLDAARKIVALTPDDFRDASGLTAERSAAIYRQGQELAAAAAVKAVAILQTGHSGASPTSVKPSAAMTDYLARVPG